MAFSKSILGLMVAAAAATGCAQTNEPRVERYADGAYRPVTVGAYDISGARDGATTHATAVFTLADGDRISVELQVAYNPTPTLAAGHWRREGAVAEEGVVREESLKFLGGQGSAPSVGGRFRLEANGAPRWRVVLPTRPLGE